MSTHDTDTSETKSQKLFFNFLREHNIVQCYLLQQDMQLKYCSNVRKILAPYIRDIYIQFKNTIMDLL
jgi:hypothetical protein